VDTDVVLRHAPAPVAAVVGLGARRGVAAAGGAVQVDPGLTALGYSACSYDTIILFNDLLTISSTCAVQGAIDPMKSVLKATGTMLWKLRYDERLSNFAFNFNLCRYTVLRSTSAAREKRLGVAAHVECESKV